MTTNILSANQAGDWVSGLCRGEPERLHEGIQSGSRWLVGCMAAIILGSGVYGATIGLWRAPQQALYTAIKFPLLMMLTALGNVLINGMFAQVLGLGIRFRDSFSAVLSSFAISSIILASLSPVTLFILLNTPPLGAENTLMAHNFTLLTHIVIIAFAGVAGCVRLYWLLAKLGGGKQAARSVLIAWLAANMFLGCQLSWNMRPFIGSPGLVVEFFRPDAFKGNFYETTFTALSNLTWKKEKDHE